MQWLFLTILLLGGPLTQLGQADLPPALIVTIRDEAGAGVAGVQVLVRHPNGRTDLARAITDDHGQAALPSLPLNMVRVLVLGQLPDGAFLRQEGQDIAGVLVVLDAIPTELALRVTSDGVVIPDPTVMITPDLGVPFEQVLPVTRPIAPTPDTRGTPTALPAELPRMQAPAEELPWQLGALLLAVVVFCAAGLLVFIRSVRQ